MAGDEDVITDYGSAWGGSRPNRAHLMDRTICAHLGSGVYSNLARMRYQQARSNFRIGTEIYVRQKCKDFLRYREDDHDG